MRALLLTVLLVVGGFLIATVLWETLGLVGGRLLGGPHDYDGNELRKAHAPLIERGLNDVHFDIVADHLRATLVELKVEGSIIAEAMIVVAGTRMPDPS